MDGEDFYAAGFRGGATYHAVWGAAAIAFPALPRLILHVQGEGAAVLLATAGALALASAYACRVAASDPRRHRELASVILLANALIAIVCGWNAALGVLLPEALWILVPGALWLPFFAAFLRWERRSRMAQLIARAGMG
ncbi:MAG TPA: hypothetical protein VFH27_16620 [Longimicrobiaceae bacterium]|nr:hypothetical protein [Longimicrobiaceae bacterium]